MLSWELELQKYLALELATFGVLHGQGPIAFPQSSHIHNFTMVQKSTTCIKANIHPRADVVYWLHINSYQVAGAGSIPVVSSAYN